MSKGDDDRHRLRRRAVGRRIAAAQQHTWVLPLHPLQRHGRGELDQQSAHCTQDGSRNQAFVRLQGTPALSLSSRVGQGTSGIALSQQTRTPRTPVGHSPSPSGQVFCPPLQAGPTLQAHRDQAASQDREARWEPWGRAGHWEPRGAPSWGRWRWAERSWCCCWQLGGGHGQGRGH